VLGEEKVLELYLSQPLDHFDRLELRSWNQRFWVNDQFWDDNSPTAPVFLCIGGEGPPLDSSVLTGSPHCNEAVELASSLGALLFALEHRFYGKSLPLPDWSTESLRYLSSQQAIADISTFILSMKEQYSLGPGNKWISFGGSYPGMLSAWSRLKLPHLVHAAVSSSSPVLAQLDLQGYNDVVRSSLAHESVGGSEACAAAVASGHEAIGRMMKSSSGRAELTRLFGLCGDGAYLADDRIASAFAGDGVVYLGIQENDPSCGQASACNIEGICAIMVDVGRGSKVERLADVKSARVSPLYEYEDECIDLPARVEREHNMLLNVTNPERAWLWQTCSEFAFYQTCEEGTECPFTQGLHTLSQDLQLCQEGFGVDPSLPGIYVARTNAYYGGLDIQSSRIFFLQGDIDPWSASGVMSSADPSMPALVVRGASHHFWTHPSSPDDAPEIVAAREKIWRQVEEWLEDGSQLRASSRQ
jgi:serine protease 16